MTDVVEPTAGTRFDGVGGNTERRPDNRAINMIRALAALVVVLGHVRVLLFQNVGDAVPSAFVSLAYALTSLAPGAVIVFFVLSGYWVGGGALDRLRAGTFTWGAYAGSRLTRLWLVLIPALAVTAIADAVGTRLASISGPYLGGAAYGVDLAQISHSVPTLLGNVVFVQQVHVPTFGTNVALWSLANEFWYYLIFPATVIALTRRSTSVRIRLAAAALAVAGAVVAGPTILVLFPTWLLGALVAWRRDRIVALIRRSRRPVVAAARSLGVLGVLAGLAVTKLVPMPPVVSSMVVAVPTALMLASLTVDLGWTGPAGRVLDAGSWLAGSSYSLYAVHMPLVVLVSAVLIPSADARWPMDVPHIGLGLLVVLATMVVAIGFAAVTEKRTESVRSGVRWIARRLGDTRA